MHKFSRRNLLQAGIALVAAPSAALLQTGCSTNHKGSPESPNNIADKPSAAQQKNTEQGNPMKIYYLEIVTPNVEGSVALYSTVHGISFSAPDATLGGARTAKLPNGETLGIRAPLRDNETPVVRPYFLVQDIDKAVAAAGRSGAFIAMTPTEIPGRGKFAILIQGGIETGLWQV